MNSDPTTHPTADTTDAALLAQFDRILDGPSPRNMTGAQADELNAVCAEVVNRGGYQALQQAVAVAATAEFDGRVYYPQAGDLLPAVINTEGVDALRLADQFERTINAHRARGTATRYGATRWMRLVEAADRFAAVAGVQVG